MEKQLNIALALGKIQTKQESLQEENKLLKEQLYDVSELKETVENLLEENKTLKDKITELKRELILCREI